jgi:enoyl-CoA hydratase/carnithine racemase
MNERPVYLEKQGEIAVMVLNRPGKLNALNHEIWAAIPGLCAEVTEDPGLKVLIVRGATTKAFASGADIAEFPKVHATPDTARAYHHDIHAAYDALNGMEKPTIAMISGYCFGGGCALALCCDMRYADTTAKFCIPPARLGIAYSLKETKRLADLVGPSKAKEMLMGAKVIEAEEAATVGLATRLFQPEALESGTYGFAEELCRLSQFTIRTISATVAEIASGAHEASPALQARIMGGFEGVDYLEGRAAFLEKRKAKFTYR